MDIHTAESKSTASGVPLPSSLEIVPTTRAAWSAQRVGLILASTVALAMGSVGLTDEAYASSGGDMARYLMNGAYIHDLVTDLPFAGWSQFVEYTRLYYARYPALSLGHHPVLLPALEAASFGLFGMSVAAARLVPLVSLLAAVAFLHRLVGRRYGPLAAVTAALLFATSPMVVTFTRLVMAEILSIALVLASAYYLQRFSETGRRSCLVTCCAAFVLSLYAKPHALLVAPALAASALASIPLRRLVTRDVALALAATLVAAAPALAVPLMLSTSNLRGVMAVTQMESHSSFWGLISAALDPQLARAVLAVALVGAAAAFARRDRRSLVFLLWIASVTPALYFFGGLQNEASRYTMYWIAPWCALAASSVAAFRSRVARAAVVGTLAVGLFLQVTNRDSVTAHITGAGGYEEVAQFVLAANPGPTVLFSGDVDTGYFPFFVRKHDPERRLVILRADKIYTTSLMANTGFEDRITSGAEIYSALHQFGTRYIVIEDRPSQARVLELFRQELKSPRFVERRRVPIRSTDWRLRGTSLVVYELLESRPPDPSTVLTMHLPIVGRSLSVRLGDLIARKLLR